MAAFTLGATVLSAPAAPAAALSGQAIIRIDIPSAQVIQLRSGKTTLNRLIVAPSATVQWLGERADASGALRTRSGYMSAQKLVRAWRGFGNAEQIGATLTWSKGDRLQAASVTLKAPAATTKGQVALTFTTTQSLPKRLKNATLNVERAGGMTARSFPYSAKATYLSASLYAQVTAYNAYTAFNYFFCGPTKLAEYTTDQSMPLSSMPTLTGCDPIIKNGRLSLQTPTQIQDGFVYMQATLQPSSGASMQYSASIGSWTLNGS